MARWRALRSNSPAVASLSARAGRDRRAMAENFARSSRVSSLSMSAMCSAGGTSSTNAPVCSSVAGSVSNQPAAAYGTAERTRRATASSSSSGGNSPAHNSTIASHATTPRVPSMLIASPICGMASAAPASDDLYERTGGRHG